MRNGIVGRCQCVVWSWRGVDGPGFFTSTKDYIRVYQLDFIAILETRISGDRAATVIKKTGRSHSACLRLCRGFVVLMEAIMSSYTGCFYLTLLYTSSY